MKPHVTYYLFFLLVAAPLSQAQVPGAPSAKPEGEAPAILKRAGFDQKLNAQISTGLVFQNEAGTDVTLAQLLNGKPAILCLAYYQCPMMCTYVLNGIADACKEIPLAMGTDYNVITASFEPQETHYFAARKKAAYVKGYALPGMDTGWHFLTAPNGPAKTLADEVGFHYEWDKPTKQYAHSSGILVLTPEGRVSHYFYGIQYSPRDLRLALVDASKGAIGSPVDQMLMWCFHYDASTGKYSVAIMNLIRAGCLLTLTLLGLFFWSMSRRATPRPANSPLSTEPRTAAGMTSHP